MVCCKVYLILSTLIACHVNANHESLKTLSQQIDVSQVPWNSRYDIYEGASSKVLPRFYDSYGSNRDRSGDYFGSSSEHLPIPSFKKEPRQGNEKKISKKPIIPFYALANGDSFKHKEFVPLSAIAHCREVKVKSIGEEPRKSFTTCYKCKDPKTKSTYERCSYNGPKRSASASTKVERFLSAPVSFRYRRSSLGEGVAGDSYGDYHGKLRHPYRFAEEYFIDATHDVPAAYENKGEVCDKVVKDSMVCMVCKDAKTNGKYEQCSYVNQPREKAYSYTKSSSFGKPQEEDDSADQPEETSPKSFNFEASDRRKDRNPTVVEESRSEYRYPSEDHSNRASTKKAKEQDDGVRDDATSADCKKVQKDSKTCVICKDPANGGTYEKCTYNYQPNEKLYKYSRSKNFGYPDKTSDSSFNRETAETSDKSTDYPQSSDATHDYFDSGRLEVPTYPRRSDRLGEAKEATDDSDSTLHDSAEHGNAINPPRSAIHRETDPAMHRIKTRKARIARRLRGRDLTDTFLDKLTRLQRRTEQHLRMMTRKSNKARKKWTPDT
ncbi:hypothetical protein DMN91_008676 [Ooceraea biroi]|uniref:Uncharacterized protein n=1 Tax=Ooceraea biroi TaxID=2015173 RepID=A0A3L8DEJ6_OOCBI|nr:hypothetical protein DMN91_008676 [Ooceraea biroi]